MMTNGDHGGRIFLSHPHTNNGSFYIGKHKKDFQKILNTLRFDMVTSFEHYNDVTDQCAVDVRLFIFFYLSHGLVRVCEIDRIISHG